MEFHFCFNDKVIYFNYYYQKVLHNEDNVPSDTDEIPKITYKYNIYKSIYIYNQSLFNEEINALKRHINESNLYKTITKNNKFQFVDSLIDLASYAYGLSRKNHLISIARLDFLNADIIELVNAILINFLPKQKVNNIKDIYDKILGGYDLFKSSLFFYTDFELNTLIIKLFLESIFFVNKKLYGIKFIVYRHYILFFNHKQKILKRDLSNLQKILLNYKVGINITKRFNLTTDDVLFLNNVILENYSRVINPTSLEFIKEQVQNKIYQEINLSPSSEILLIKHISNTEFNIIKNTTSKKKIEYLQKIKFYLDLNL